MQLVVQNHASTEAGLLACNIQQYLFWKRKSTLGIDIPWLIQWYVTWLIGCAEAPTIEDAKLRQGPRYLPRYG